MYKDDHSFPEDFGLRIRRLYVLAMLALAVCLALAGCKKADAPASGGPELLLDGAAVEPGSVAPEQGEARVYVTLDGAALIDLPFGEAHTLTVRQRDGAENTVALTGGAVYMSSANCENQDCVNMGEVTLENVEVRVLGGFIVCLPHRLSVEVRVP